ncbi:MAG: serine acetyltransferase [Deltaproteobacteria bacterium]|nr:serine acetyltransferase [Deltaproteobacteria bacterium]
MSEPTTQWHRDAQTAALQVAFGVAADLHAQARLENGAPALPDPDQVAQALDLARRVLFAEIYSGARPCAEGLAGCCHELYERVVRLLVAEWTAVPGRDIGQRGELYPDRCGDPALVAASAHETALSVLEALPGLREALEADVQAALDGDPAARSRAEIILCYPGFYAIATHRLAHVLWLAGAPLVARMMTEHAHHRTGIDLHPGARIGPALFIDHGTGVVVGETAVLGARCRLYQGVTLGARSIPKGDAMRTRKRHPTLEDEVTIYANATILGGDVVIGKGAIVGGNTWVTSSVPAGARMRIDVAARVAEAVVMVPDGAQPE